MTAGVSTSRDSIAIVVVVVLTGVISIRNHVCSSQSRWHRTIHMTFVECVASKKSFYRLGIRTLPFYAHITIQLVAHPRSSRHLPECQKLKIYFHFAPPIKRVAFRIRRKFTQNYDFQFNIFIHRMSFDWGGGGSRSRWWRWRKSPILLFGVTAIDHSFWHQISK